MSKTELLEGDFAPNETAEAITVRRTASGYVLAINGQAVLKTDDVDMLEQVIKELNLPERRMQ
jgi:hypothetical protein